MKIAIDISPIKSENQKEHRVRGVGFYLEHLKDGLEKYVPDLSYCYFTNEDPLDEPVDLVHYPYFDPFFLTLPKKKKQKTVVTIHDLTPLVFPKHFPVGMKGTIRWHMQKRLLKKVDAIITDSQVSKNDIIRIGKIVEGKIHIVYLAAGEEFRKVSISKEQRLRVIKKYDLPEKFVLSVGDVTWNKNLPRFIQAMDGTNIPVILVGKAITQTEYDRNNSWNKDLVQVQQALKKSVNIRALGFVPTEDLILLYNLARVFVMPSIYEGFGLPILEAMACGCPVITTQEGSLPEVAGDAAFFVDAYSIRSIADGVKQVYNTKSLRDKLSQKGDEHVKKFSWYKTAKETAAVYAKIAK